MNLAGVELVKDLHEDERVEDDGVVLRGRCVEGGVPPTVNVKYLLTCEREGQTLLSICFYIRIPDIHILIMMVLLIGLQEDNCNKIYKGIFNVFFP